MIRKSPDRRRPGYTLMELLVATASATVLMAGLSSSIYVASQALQIDNGSLAAEARNGRALERLLADAREALAFSEQTATAITFTVPDRTGDEVPETIRYAWSGSSGDPLTYEMNGSVPATLVEDVRQLTFDYLTRTLAGADAGSTSTSTPAVVYQEYSDAQQSSQTTSITIDTPSGVAESDLLIAAVAVDNEEGDSLAPPAGWTELVATDHSKDITFGVWWKLASASEVGNHTFTWSGNETAYGWIMHFTGHDTTNPINVSQPGTGDHKFPTAESVTTTVDNCLILRLGGFNEDDITVGSPGINDHDAITMRSSGANSSDAASGGAAYTVQESAGGTGSVGFELSRKREYITLTIAIAPNTSGG